MHFRSISPPPPLSIHFWVAIKSCSLFTQKKNRELGNLKFYNRFDPAAHHHQQTKKIKEKSSGKFITFKFEQPISKLFRTNRIERERRPNICRVYWFEGGREELRFYWHLGKLRDGKNSFEIPCLIWRERVAFFKKLMLLAPFFKGDATAAVSFLEFWKWKIYSTFMCERENVSQIDCREMSCIWFDWRRLSRRRLWADGRMWCDLMVEIRLWIVTLNVEYISFGADVQGGRG